MRSERRPVYQEFESAAQVFATAAADRAECDRSKSRTCDTTIEQLQHARYRTQVAINQMRVFGTPEAREAMRGVARTLPPTQVGLIGSPVVESVDSAAFSEAISTFYTVTCMDVSPAPEDC